MGFATIVPFTCDACGGAISLRLPALPCPEAPDGWFLVGGYVHGGGDDIVEDSYACSAACAAKIFNKISLKVASTSFGLKKSEQQEKREE